MSKDMKMIWKRFLAGALVLFMVISILPTDILYAAENGSVETQAESSDSTDKQQIMGFVGLDERQAAIYVNGKVSKDLLTARMPISIEAYVAGRSDTVSIPVTWECVGDYEDTNYFYYEFDPQWDETQYAISASAAKELPYIGVSLTGDRSLKYGSSTSNEYTIYKFLKDKLGLNTAAACGVLANIYSESGFNPTASIIDTNGKTSYGICQWNGSRFDDLRSYCTTNGYDYKTLTGQLNFLKYELEHTERSAFAKVKDVANSSEGAYTAGYNWARYFERCNSVYFEGRAKRARDTYWKKYGKDSEKEPITKKYKVTYELYDGENNSSNPETFYETSGDLALKAATKEGYTFAGWYTESSFKNKVSAIKSGTTKDVKLYAKWNVHKYTIRFNGNKATSGSTSQMSSKEYDSSYKLRANGFKRKGYKFTGWNTKSNGKGTAYANKEEIENLSSKDGAVITLYAQWSKEKYTITYKANGGKLPKGNPKSYAVNTKTTKLKNPTQKGYTFKGWYTDKKFKKKITQITKGSTGKLTLYAKWSTNSYRIEYKGNGSTSGKMSGSTNYKYGNTYTLAANKFKRTGYTFTGWNTKADGSGRDYDNKEKVRNLSIKNKQTITLYAQWTKKEYTIKYKLNDGTVVKSNRRTYYYDTKTFKLSNPVREGYTFQGWYTESTFKNRITQIKKGTQKNYKLYAKWQLNQYTIHFNRNGGTSGKLADMNNCKYGQEYTLPANTFKRTGYTFIGWSTAANGGDTFYGNQAAVHNLTTANGATVTLYAQWELTTAN